MKKIQTIVAVLAAAVLATGCNTVFMQESNEPALKSDAVPVVMDGGGKLYGWEGKSVVTGRNSNDPFFRTNQGGD